MKKRALQISVTKPDAEPTQKPSVSRDDVVYWNAVLIANAQQAAIGFVAIYAAVKIIDTASKVAIIKATADLA